LDSRPNTTEAFWNQGPIWVFSKSTPKTTWAPAGRRTEVGRLAGAFNSMLTQIAAHQLGLLRPDRRRWRRFHRAAV